MENRLKKAFENLKMSDECAEKIRTSLCCPRSQRIHFAPIAIAASLLLVIFVFTNSTAVTALETVGESIKAAVTELLIPDKPVTEEYKTENGNIIIQTTTNKEGKEEQHTAYTSNPDEPEFLKVESDGLYFVGNGEHIEISSIISEDVPFTYIITHESGLREYIAIGGTYGVGDEGLDLVGWEAWHQKPPYEHNSWIGGYGKNIYDKETGEKCAWHYAAKDIMDIPFP